MSIVDDVAAQLADELGDIVRTLGDVLGLDLRMDMEQRLDSRVAILAAELCCEDDRLAAEAVRTLIGARWPDGCDIPPTWWSTPAGRMVARSVGRDDTEAVTWSVAAAMLGVTKGTVSQLMHRKSLTRHPDGGITRSSVLERLAAQAG